VRAVILDDYLACAQALGPWDRLAERVAFEFVHERIPDASGLADRLAGRQIVGLMRERTTFGADVFAALPDLRLIVTSGMVNSAIDLDAATRAGVVVSGTGSLSHPPVELTWGLILAVVRGIVAEDTAMRTGAWQTMLGRSLRGMRLGILGLGRIGMDVVAWSEHLTAAQAKAAGATLVKRDELLETSHVVTLHLRLSDRTRGMIGRTELDRMKPSAVLINTSRAAIVDEDSLLEAIRKRRIAGVGLDVYWDEPISEGHPIFDLDRVVLTPHIGYVTEDNFRRYYLDMVDDIEAFLGGNPARVLNPEVRQVGR
jgi:phosphoglycerate dehydrogenase-like enzyme